MTHFDFVKKFNNQLSAISYYQQLSIAIEVCKKLYCNYLLFIEKYQWGNPDILLDAIDMLEQSKTRQIELDSINTTLQNIDSIMPEMSDYEMSDYLPNYGFAACLAVYSSVKFLSTKQSECICDIGINFTDIIYFKLSKHEDLTDDEIDDHPLMIDARNYLFETANNTPLTSPRL